MLQKKSAVSLSVCATDGPASTMSNRHYTFHRGGMKLEQSAALAAVPDHREPMGDPNKVNSYFPRCGKTPYSCIPGWLFQYVTRIKVGDDVYRVRNLLGAGYNGQVYEAVNEGTGAISVRRSSTQRRPTGTPISAPSATRNSYRAFTRQVLKVLFQRQHNCHTGCSKPCEKKGRVCLEPDKEIEKLGLPQVSQLFRSAGPGMENVCQCTCLVPECEIGTQLRQIMVDRAHDEKYGSLLCMPCLAPLYTPSLAPL